MNFSKKITNLADIRYNLGPNVIKLNKNNTPEHELAKCLLCLECLNNNTEFFTEMIFKNSKRADIYIPILGEDW